MGSTIARFLSAWIPWVSMGSSLIASCSARWARDFSTNGSTGFSFFLAWVDFWFAGGGVGSRGGGEGGGGGEG